MQTKIVGVRQHMDFETKEVHNFLVLSIEGAVFETQVFDASVIEAVVAAHFDTPPATSSPPVAASIAEPVDVVNPMDVPVLEKVAWATLPPDILPYEARSVLEQADLPELIDPVALSDFLAEFSIRQEAQEASMRRPEEGTSPKLDQAVLAEGFIPTGSRPSRTVPADESGNPIIRGTVPDDDLGDLAEDGDVNQL